MLFERLERVALIVLGADSKDYPATRQVAGIFLKGDKRFARGASLPEDQSGQTVIADHTAPDRIVEVKHEAFGRPSLLGADQSTDEIAVERRRNRRDLLFAVMPEHRVVPRLEPVRDSAIVDRQDIDTGLVGHGPQFAV